MWTEKLAPRNMLTVNITKYKSTKARTLGRRLCTDSAFPEHCQPPLQFLKILHAPSTSEGLSHALPSLLPAFDFEFVQCYQQLVCHSVAGQTQALKRLTLVRVV